MRQPAERHGFRRMTDRFAANGRMSLLGREKQSGRAAPGQEQTVATRKSGRSTFDFSGAEDVRWKEGLGVTRDDRHR